VPIQKIGEPIYHEYKRVTPERLLDESVFYKLLITQLRNQDPLSPMNPEDFTAQLAQLTQLEEVRKLKEYMKFLCAGFIGKWVRGGEDDEFKKVEAVEIDRVNNKIILELEDGSTLDIDEVREIKQDVQEKNEGKEGDSL